MYCPDCGDEARTIEITEPDASGELKVICTCDDCETIFHVFRNVPMCGCGSPATHEHGKPCCGGSMCCAHANE